MSIREETTTTNEAPKGHSTHLEFIRFWKLNISAGKMLMVAPPKHSGSLISASSAKNFQLPFPIDLMPAKAVAASFMRRRIPSWSVGKFVPPMLVSHTSRPGVSSSRINNAVLGGPAGEIGVKQAEGVDGIKSPVLPVGSSSAKRISWT